MMRLVVTFFCLLINFSLEADENHNVIFIIISQNNEYNEKLATRLEYSLNEQVRQLGLKPKIYISNKHFANITADWTYVPLITPIINIIDTSTKWVVFLEDRTNVTLKILLDCLYRHDATKDVWIGHALHDSEASIIHHFAFYEDPTFFKYPNLGSGMALSVPMLNRLKALVKRGFKQIDFHIDPAHEFALFVYDEGNGSLIQHDHLFCTKKGPNCATYPKKMESCEGADTSSIFFAIKTCQKFHNDRVKVVKQTWHKYVERGAFFSDFEDPNIPTTSLGVPNTEQGHCEKTMAILRYCLKQFNNDTRLQWLALVDDDTILSVSRMARLAACHTNSSQPLILGERYRFGAQGFNYATGGAGILVNRAGLKALAGACNCPRPDSPDDMVLGACAEEFAVALVHVPQMHQARPADYAPGRLATDDALSFHKHWIVDPVQVYERWFSTDDQQIARDAFAKLEL